MKKINGVKLIVTYHIYSNIRRKFFPDSSSKEMGGGGGVSYNRAQSSKNRANDFVISNNLFRLGSTAASLYHLFCFITYHVRPHEWQHPWIEEYFFSVVVLWNVSRLGSTLKLFPSVKMVYETPRIHHVLYHASRCTSMMCTLFIKTGYTLSLTLIFTANLTTCSTFFT
jgi:hypothetical protein